MKISNRAPVALRGRSKEATAVEHSVRALMKRYGVELVRYVSHKLIEAEVAKVKLREDISQKEWELEQLKRKKV